MSSTTLHVLYRGVNRVTNCEVIYTTRINFGFVNLLFTYFHRFGKENVSTTTTLYIYGFTVVRIGRYRQEGKAALYRRQAPSSGPEQAQARQRANAAKRHI